MIGSGKYKPVFFNICIAPALLGKFLNFVEKKTAALFIDIEKAYDSIWRDGLMVKLKEMGITGRIWQWIKDFLTDRSARINMSGVKGVDYSTAIGLPQGSVISPLLFSLFIADWYKNVKSESVKFADDGTVWMSGKDWPELMEILKEDFYSGLQNGV